MSQKDDAAGGVKGLGGDGEFLWAAKKIWILFLCWTLPLRTPPRREVPPDERASARVVGLALISALALSVQSAPGGSDTSNVILKIGLTALATGFAPFVDLVTPRKKRLNEFLVISGYFSMLAVLFLFIVCNAGFSQWFSWYQTLAEWIDAHFPSLDGFTSAACLVASVGTWLLWIAKVRIIDGRWARPASLAIGLGVTAVAGLIVYVVATVSWDELSSWIPHAQS